MSGIALCAPGVANLSFDGNFDATASAGTATSATRNITVPAGNSGTIIITFVDVGTVLLAQYSKNGGAFTTFSSGDTLAFVNGDTLALKTTGDNAGESRTYTIKDYAAAVTVQTGVHTGA